MIVYTQLTRALSLGPDTLSAPLETNIIPIGLSVLLETVAHVQVDVLTQIDNPSVLFDTILPAIYMYVLYIR